jgi:hypothetical protein
MFPHWQFRKIKDLAVNGVQLGQLGCHGIKPQLQLSFQLGQLVAMPSTLLDDHLPVNFAHEGRKGMTADGIMSAQPTNPCRRRQNKALRRLDGIAHDNDMVRITVADTGSGISPDVASQLFQPFVTTKQQGMGVGLSICRTIVESHGGQIWAEPNPGGGTVFHFTLKGVRQEEVGNAV